MRKDENNEKDFKKSAVSASLGVIIGIVLGLISNEAVMNVIVTINLYRRTD